ncbi:transcriptional regulator with XRE-family HTH domain [Bradyrhizobium elkanii]
MSREAAIGRHVGILRDQADIRQHELAKQLGWSPAVLSRVESGERPLSADELDAALTAIDTEEARAFPARLARQWRLIPEPSFDDPDADLLWEAEQAAQKVDALAAQPDVKSFFERRIARYKDELLSAAARLGTRRYQVVLTGSIAAGKTMAICRAEGLELVNAKGAITSVLETGPGGTTVCEVHIKRGPQYGIFVEPCTDEEVRRHVLDFARSLLDAKGSTHGEPDDEENEEVISREINRAIRNMTGLVYHPSHRSADGTRLPRIDQARVLAERAGDMKTLAVEVLALMQLHRRDRRDIWYSPSLEKAPLAWLQDVFREINNGLHPEFSLPRRIEVIVPNALLNENSLTVTLVDTQGIDDVAGRADLEQHFDDPHTIVVLCSKFEDAPSIHVRELLRRAREAGVRTLDRHAAVLVLARPGDALKVKDRGALVETEEEGYELKGDEVRLRLTSLRVTDDHMLFFNAAEQDPEVLRAFLRARIAGVRAEHREGLQQIVADANALLVNYEKEQAKEAIRVGAQPLVTWLTHSSGMTEAPSTHVQDSLVEATKVAHPGTIRASVVRDGDWPKLNYGHHLAHGARRMAAQVVEPKLDAFRVIATNILQTKDFALAHDLARQAMRTLEDGFNALIRKVQLVGQSIYADDLSVDTGFWQGCRGERGKGYRDRVNVRNKNWFKQDEGKEADHRVQAVITDEWTATIASVSQLMPKSTD